MNKLSFKVVVEYDVEINENREINTKIPKINIEFTEKSLSANILYKDSFFMLKPFKTISIEILANITIGIFNALYVTRYKFEDLIDYRPHKTNISKEKVRNDKVQNVLNSGFIYLAILAGYTRENIGDYIQRNTSAVTIQYHKFLKGSVKFSDITLFRTLLDMVMSELKSQLNLYKD